MRSPAEGADAGATPASVNSGSLAKRQATGLQNRRYGFESHGSHRQASVVQRQHAVPSRPRRGFNSLRGRWGTGPKRIMPAWLNGKSGRLLTGRVQVRFLARAMAQALGRAKAPIHRGHVAQRQSAGPMSRRSQVRLLPCPSLRGRVAHRQRTGLISRGRRVRLLPRPSNSARVG